MKHVSATRSELLARRARIALVHQGRELLKQKRKELLKAFRESVHGVLATGDAMERAAASSRQTLGLALALDGPPAVYSASWAAAGDLFIEARAATVMGVSVPYVERRDVGRSRTARGYSLSGTSPRIDRVAEDFEAQLDLVLELAAGELRLRRLAAEIEKTTRRANAVEHVLLPRLEGERDQIELTLHERERESTFRLKRARGKKQAHPLSEVGGIR